jgi:hypothetical protein
VVWASWEDIGVVWLAYGVWVARPHRTRRFEIEASTPSEAPPAGVLAYLRAPATWSSWQSEIVATHGPEVVGEGDVVNGDARLLGFDVTGHSSVLKVSPEEFQEEVIVGVRMRVTYSVKPIASGSVITHRMEADLPAGLAGSVLSLLLGWRLKRMQKGLLRRLARQAGRAQDEGEPS